MAMSRRLRGMSAGAALSLTVILATPTIARARQCQPSIDGGWELWRQNYDATNRHMRRSSPLPVVSRRVSIPPALVDLS